MEIECFFFKKKKQTKQIPTHFLLLSCFCCPCWAEKGHSEALWHCRHQRYPCWTLRNLGVWSLASALGCACAIYVAPQCYHCRNWYSCYWSWRVNPPSTYCSSVLTPIHSPHPGRTSGCCPASPREVARCRGQCGASAWPGAAGLCYWLSAAHLPLGYLPPRPRSSSPLA